MVESRRHGRKWASPAETFGYQCGLLMVDMASEASNIDVLGRFVSLNSDIMVAKQTGDLARMYALIMTKT